MFDLIDTLIIDLQDVGTRVYTFSSSMLRCMRAAALLGKKIVVLDRPNPLGGLILEGNCLEPELFSFVGPAALPMRHGLTMGEMARLFNQAFGLGCDLDVIAMVGWRRRMTWGETGLRWVMPSPNMPFPETAFVYPGQVLWKVPIFPKEEAPAGPLKFSAPLILTRLPSKNVWTCGPLRDAVCRTICFVPHFTNGPVSFAMGL